MKRVLVLKPSQQETGEPGPPKKTGTRRNRTGAENAGRGRILCGLERIYSDMCDFFRRIAFLHLGLKFLLLRWSWYII